MNKLAPLLMALALSGCETLPSPENRPDPRPQAAWEKELERLGCNFDRHSLTVRSSGGLRFAITGVCGGGNLGGTKPEFGNISLIAVDTGRGEIHATRMVSNTIGGLHYTASGELMWFSGARTDALPGDRRFIEVFSAPAGSVDGRSLGRLETPFVAGTPVLLEGDGCHLLTAFSAGSESRYEQKFWLLRDEDPIGTAKVVEGAGRVLYWNPLGKYFVTRKPKLDRQATYSRLSCSGEVSPVEGDEAARLAAVPDLTGSFLALANGDLVATNTSREPGSGNGMELLVFREGRPMERIGPFSVDFPFCPDMACESVGLSAILMGASPSGRHFLVLVPFADSLTVYRVEDLGVARRWVTSAFTRYVPILLDDTTVMQLEDRGPVAYYSW